MPVDSLSSEFRCSSADCCCRLIVVCWALTVALTCVVAAGSIVAPSLYAQGKNDNAKQKDAKQNDTKLKEAEAKAAAALKRSTTTLPRGSRPVTVAPPSKGPDLFGLWFQGGPLMYPITAISFSW